MKNILVYNGYTSRIDFNPETGAFSGHIGGIPYEVPFYGDTIAELSSSFEKAVDNYLTTCTQLGYKPSKPYDGDLKTKIPAELHAAIVAAAEEKGQSLDEWVAEALDKASNI